MAKSPKKSEPDKSEPGPSAAPDDPLAKLAGVLAGVGGEMALAMKSAILLMYNREGAEVRFMVSSTKKELLHFEVDEMIAYLKGRGYATEPPARKSPFATTDPGPASPGATEVKPGAMADKLAGMCGETITATQKEALAKMAKPIDPVEAEANRLIEKAKQIKETNELLRFWHDFMAGGPATDEVSRMTHDLLTRPFEVKDRVWKEVLLPWKRLTGCAWDDGAKAWIPPPPEAMGW